MRVLAIETSSMLCSVAAGGEGHWLEKTVSAGNSHSEIILPMIETILGEAGWPLGSLDGIGFGAGPGSFTGVRIACGVAQGLALGTDLPVVPVGTLAALAEASGQERVLACVDARMGEVYFAAYEHSGTDWRTVIPPGVGIAATVTRPDSGSWHGVGNGFACYPELVARMGGSLLSCVSDAYPRAAAVGRLAELALEAGEGIHAREATPVYVLAAGSAHDRRTSTWRAPVSGGAVSVSKALALRWRPMQEADLENVIQLENSVHAAPWTLGNFRDALNAGYSARLGELGDEIMAYGILVLGAGEAQLLNLSVASQAQHSGFGGTLLDYFIDQAVHLGAQQMFLEVRVSNLAALHFIGVAVLFRSRDG